MSTHANANPERTQRALVFAAEKAAEWAASAIAQADKGRLTMLPFAAALLLGAAAKAFDAAMRPRVVVNNHHTES